MSLRIDLVTEVIKANYDSIFELLSIRSFFFLALRFRYDMMVSHHQALHEILLVSLYLGRSFSTLVCYVNFFGYIFGDILVAELKFFEGIKLALHGSSVTRRL